MIANNPQLWAITAQLCSALHRYTHRHVFNMAAGYWDYFARDHSSFQKPESDSQFAVSHVAKLPETMEVQAPDSPLSQRMVEYSLGLRTKSCRTSSASYLTPMQQAWNVRHLRASPKPPKASYNMEPKWAAQVKRRSSTVPSLVVYYCEIVQTALDVKN